MLAALDWVVVVVGQIHSLDWISIVVLAD